MVGNGAWQPPLDITSVFKNVGLVATDRIGRIAAKLNAKDSVLQYETDLKADRFLVMALGPTAEVERAKRLLTTSNPSRLDVHDTGASKVATPEPAREHA
jgi:hypothetical protein